MQPIAEEGFGTTIVLDKHTNRVNLAPALSTIKKNFTEEKVIDGQNYGLVQQQLDGIAQGKTSRELHTAMAPSNSTVITEFSSASEVDFSSTTVDDFFNDNVVSHITNRSNPGPVTILVAVWRRGHPPRPSRPRDPLGSRRFSSCY